MPALSHGQLNGVVPCLLCLQCPCRYFHSSGREEALLICRAMALERERECESEMQAGGGEGVNIKRKRC